jgi:hypothetical protein
MSHHDRDVEIAAFLRNNGVTRCPTACVVPTQGSPSLADQAALAETRSCPRIAADEKRNSMASFRLFAGSELSLGTVLASAIPES